MSWYVSDQLAFCRMEYGVHSGGLSNSPTIKLRRPESAKKRMLADPHRGGRWSLLSERDTGSLLIYLLTISASSFSGRKD